MSGTALSLFAQAMSPSESRLAHRTSRHVKEKIIELILFLAALVSVFTTLGIVYILVSESVVFFSHVPGLTSLSSRFTRRALASSGSECGHRFLVFQSKTVFQRQRPDWQRNSFSRSGSRCS